MCLPDDYYSFTTKTNEGFDQFDLDRIRKNARITFKDPYGKRFEFEKRMSDPDNPLNRIGEGFRLEPQETPGVTALNIYFERLNAFNKNHYYTEQDHMFLRARIKNSKTSMKIFSKHLSEPIGPISFIIRIKRKRPRV
jgi:hypothetical protein